MRLLVWLLGFVIHVRGGNRLRTYNNRDCGCIYEARHRLTGRTR